ncbi:PH domain-containing protein [Coralloluteibacterium thermophilus]|uniref:PH domain-containing protein n=1 Tax=Coralloluteibacterium thermophilum TaxID=2707049 RepID=A0ABV9NH37_9GAMM
MTGPEPDATPPAPIDWRPLPRAAAWVFALSGALSLLGPAVGLGIAASVLFLRRHGPETLIVGVGALLFAALLAGALLGWRRWRSTRWMLDGAALRIRRGIWWQAESLVPRSRVQHLDLERGPLERQAGLATLIVYTAGTRMAAVRLPGLSADDAGWLRDNLVHDSSDDDDAL